MTFYHGSTSEIKEFRNGCIYLSSNLNDCLEFIAARVESDNATQGCIYSIEIDLNESEVEDDFAAFDCGGYLNPKSWDANIVYNPESGWIFIKDAANRIFELKQTVETTTSSLNSTNAVFPAGFAHIMKFGKHKGKSLAQILDEDYGYIIWLSEENVLSIDEKVTGMAYDLQNKDGDDYSWADWHDMF